MNADFEMLVAAEALDAAMVQTAEGEVLYRNPGAEAIFGYARVEAIGRSIEDLTVPDNRREEERRWIRETLQAGQNHIRIASATEGRVARLCRRVGSQPACGRPARPLRPFDQEGRHCPQNPAGREGHRGALPRPSGDHAGRRPSSSARPGISCSPTATPNVCSATRQASCAAGWWNFASGQIP